MFKHLFNVITGNDLGKSTSSFNQLGSSLLPSEPFGQADQQLYINATNGNIHLADHSKTIVDLGFNLYVGMVYNSQATKPDQAWRFSLGKTIGAITGKLNTEGSSVAVNQPDGSTITFNFDAQAKQYVAQGLAGGNQYLISSSDGTWECRQPGSGIIEHYDAQNKQRNSVDAAGHAITFSYDGGGRLKDVRGSSGQKVSLERNGLQTVLKLTTVEGTEKTLATYTYDEQDRLKISEFPLNDTEKYSVNYDYLGNTLALYMIRQDDGTKLEFDYEKQGDKLQVVEITDGEGRSYTLDYSAGKTQLTDALKNITEFGLNSQGQLQNIIKTDIQGNPQITQYDYYDDSALKQISYSDNTEESFTYDALGLLSIFADGLGQTTRYCNNVQTGACFSKTQYLQTSQGRQALTTWYVHNAKRQLCYEISPAGTVTKYDYDLNGNPVAVRQYLAEQINVSQFQPNVEITVDTLDNWWSQLKDKSKISLKELDYNERGQVQRETIYADINAEGGGVFNEKTAQVVTEWGLFNQWEERTERQTADKQVITARKYDGLIRLALETDAEGNETEYEYKSLHPVQEQGAELKYTQIITLPNGLKKETVYDHSGRPSQLIDIDKSNIARVTTYGRDKAGRILAIQQPDGRFRFDYFDPQGRLAYEINSKGYITEHCYDDYDREIETIQYAQNITISVQNPPILKALMALIVKNDKDRHQFNIYNAAGKLQYQIDGENGLTQHFYDSTNRKIKTQRYATSISDSNIQALLAGNIVFIPENEKDRNNYFYYDNNNNLIGELDPDNYVTEYVRDAAGRLKERIYYNTPSQYKADFNQVRPVETQQDAHEYYYRDAKGNCLRKINAENILTVYQYNANGKLAEKIKYKNPVDPKFPNQIPKKHFEDKRFVYEYDPLNRLTICDEYPFKKRTIKQYDAMGNKTDESIVDLQGDNNNSSRSESFQYNAWGQIELHTNSRGGITRHIYDNSGLRLQTIDPVKNTTFFYYNDARQLCLTINGEGSIKQEDYDAFDNEPILVRTYAQQLTKEQLKTLSGGFYAEAIKNLIEPLKNDAKDSVLPVVRDRRGLVKTQIDAEGYATHYQRNTFKECTSEAKQITKPDPVLPSVIATMSESKVGSNPVANNLDCHVANAPRNDILEDDCVVVMPAKAGIQEIITTKLKFLTTTHDYNKRGLETRTIVDPKTSDNPDGLNISKQQTYNMHGEVEKIIDGRGYAHQFEYDRLAREKKYTDPQNKTREKIWDSFDRLEVETDRCGKDTNYSYNTPERTVTVTTPEKRATVTQVNVFNEKINTQDANGAVETFERDAGGEVSVKIDPLNRRTEDQYDLAGRHQQHRDFTGVNTDYQFDAANKINFYADAPKDKPAEAFTTQIKRDSQGNEIIKINSRNVTKQEQRDCRGLEINTITDPSGLNLTTSHTYNGLKQQEFTFQGDAGAPKQHITQTLYDSASRESGKIVDPKNQDNPGGKSFTTINTLDNAGNIIAISDPNSNESNNKTNIYRNIFDELNRKVFAVDPTGAVTKFEYDAEGREVLRCNYANRIDMTKIDENTTPERLKQLIQKSADDRSLYSRYDGDGKLIFSITSTGRVIEHIYDKAGRQVGFTRYNNPIDPTKLATLDPAEVKKLLVKNPDEDRTYYGILDLAGQVRFNMGPDGHVMEQKFDGHGNIIAKIVYKNAIDIMQINSSSTPDDIAKLIQPLEGQDRITHQIFDGFNRLIFSVNPRNYVTEYKYDEEDNPINTVVYYNRIPTLPAQKTVDTIRAALIRDPKNSKDRITQQIYDNADRKVEIIDGLGYSEAYEFDALNQLRTRKDKIGYLWQTEYDPAGRKTYEKTPETTITNVEFDEYNKLIEKVTRGTIVTKEECDANGNKRSVTLGFGSANPRRMIFTYTPNNLIDTTTIENVAVDDPTIITPDIKNRPEKTVPLTTKTVYNVWNQPVAYKNEKDIWSFKVFDTEGHLVYDIDGNLHVTEHQWNAFGEEEKFIRYNTPLAINPQDYRVNGLSIADVQAKLQKDPANDRTISTEHNKRGSKMKVLQDKVFIYNPLLKDPSLRDRKAEAIQESPTGLLRDARNDKLATDKSLPNVVLAAPEKQWQYNDFNEEILESELIDPVTDRWAKKHKWRDLQGNIIAEADANGYVKLYQRNGDNKIEERIEYDEALPVQYLDISYNALLKLVDTIKNPKKDRVYRCIYNVMGKKQEEIFVNAIFQKVVFDKDDKPHIINLPPQDLKKTYVRDEMGRVVKTIYENGQGTTKSYDEIGRINGESKLPRESKDSKNALITYLEFYKYGFNEFGNKTKIIRTSQTIPNNKSQANAFLPKDQITYREVDNRGLDVVEKLPDGSIFFKTYTATKKEARRYGKVERWLQDQTNKKNFITVKKLFQNRKGYDAVDNEIAVFLWDYKTDKEILTAKKFNAFNQQMAEGPGNNEWPVYWNFDQAGRMWRSNSGEKFVATIVLHDARGDEARSCIIHAALLDLSPNAISYADLPNLLLRDYTEVQRTEIISDNRGSIVQQNLPPFKHLKPGTPEKPGSPEPLYTGFTIGSYYTNDFGQYNVSWPQGAEVDLVAELKVWVKDTDELNAKYLPVKIANGRMGADISALIADIYEYQLTYYYQDPNIGRRAKDPTYQARGEFPLDTGITQGSQHLVLIQQDDCTIILTGKTADPDNNNNMPLSGVELIQNGKVVARVAASTTEVAGRYELNFSKEMSGTYTCRPIFGFNSIGNPISIGQTSPAGFRLEAHQPNLQMTLQQREKIFHKYTIQTYDNEITWSDLPPGCQNLRGVYEVCSDDGGGVNPIFSDFHRTTVDFPASLGKYRYGGFDAEEYIAVNNFLYALDSQQQPWLIGTGYNKAYPDETGGKFTVYAIPTQSAPVSADAIAVTNNSNPISTLPLQDWMEGMQCVSVKDGQNFQYQLLQLNPNSSNVPESQPFSIITAHQTPRLQVRELGMDDFCVACDQDVGALVPSNLKLPEDLAFSPAYIKLDWEETPYVPQYYFGKATYYAYGVTAYIPPKVTLSLEINNDWVPLFSGFPYATENNDLTAYFRFRVLCFSSLPANIATVNFEYFDFTLGAAAVWRTIEAIQFSKNNTTMIVDTLSLEFGQYNYRFQAFDVQGKQIDLSNITDVENGYAIGQFKVGAANICVVPEQTEMFEQVYPSHSQTLDHWKNITSKTNEMGDTTKFIINGFDKIEQEIKPEIIITTESGAQKKVNPTTLYAYNEMQAVIGMRDANEHWLIHIRNSAGETLATIRADGVTIDFVLDAFGRNVILRNAKGDTTFVFNDRDCIIEHVDAEGCVTKSSYNELKQQTSLEKQITVSSKTSKRTKSLTLRMGHNCYGDVSDVYQPNGEHVITEFDRNQQPTSIDDNTPKGAPKPVTTERDYFGYPLNGQAAHTDKSGAKYTETRNFNQQIVKRTSSGGKHGNQYGPDGKTLIPVPPQSLQFLYDHAGHKIYALDDGAQLTTRYLIDAMGRRIGEWFKAWDGQVYQNTHIKFNTCGWIVSVKDTRIEGTYGYDAKGNRRFTIVYYWDKGIKKPLLKQYWNKYNEADNMEIYHGKLINGKIKLSPENTDGVQLTYEEGTGWRHTETQFNQEGQLITKTLEYFKNGLLEDTSGTDGSSSNAVYDEAYRRTTFNEFIPGQNNNETQTYNTVYNDNSWVVSQQVLSNQEQKSYAQFNDFDDAGHELAETNNLEENIVDQLTSTYVSYDTQLISQNSGTRYQNGQQIGPSLVLTVTYDADGNFRSVEGAVPESFRLFIVNEENRVVLKTAGEMNNGSNKREYYFYDPEGNVIGRFGDIPDTIAPPSDVDFDLNFVPVSDKFPPPAPGVYVASEKQQTFADVSRIVFGEDSYAGEIAHYNNYSEDDPVPPNAVLEIPSIVNTNLHNWAGIYHVQNSAEILGGIYPNMPLPPPPQPKEYKHNFLKEFIEFGVAAAVLALAPQFAAALEPFIAPLFLEIFGTAPELLMTVISNVIAGELLGVASSFAQQETARALGDQNHFSYHQMWQSGMQNAEGAGLSAGLHIPNPFLKQEYFTKIWDAEQFAVGMQVLELAFKQEKKFDWKAILTAALQATANDVISSQFHETKKDITEDINKDVTKHLAEQMPLTFVDDFITQEVYNRRFDGELAAANATGSFAGNLAALSAYQYFSNKNSQKDQKPQKSWQNEKRKINRDESNLADTTQKINAELAALGNINPFTGEPLDSGVTHNSQMGNDSTRMRQAQSGTPNDPTTNNTNKNPSYGNRQAQHDTSVNQAQGQSNFQQQQTNLAAKGSSKPSFLQSLENSVGDYLFKVEEKQRLFNDGRYGFKQDVSKLSPELQEAYDTGNSKSIHLGDKVANWEFGALGFADLAASIGMFAVKNIRQIANIARIASNVANKPFITEEAIAEGWKPPFPENTTLRKITTGIEMKFLRVFTGDDPTGGFVVREKEIAHIMDSPEKLQTYLGLNETPTGIVEVHVPSGTNMLVGRIAAQPNFGLMENSGFQYQILDRIPLSNFTNPRPIVSMDNAYSAEINP